MRSILSCCIPFSCLVSLDIWIGGLDRVTANIFAVRLGSLGTNSSGNRLISSNPGHSYFGIDSTPPLPVQRFTRQLVCTLVPVAFHVEYIVRGPRSKLTQSFPFNGVSPAALHSISPRICLTTRLESPQIINRRRSNGSSNSKPSSMP